MEPLTEENAKLKEAMKLMEKNIQRAQCERDLAEANARDLEYKRGLYPSSWRLCSSSCEAGLSSWPPSPSS